MAEPLVRDDAASEGVLGRARRSRGASLEIAPGEVHAPDRPERRRQVDAHQDPDRRLPPRRRRGRCSPGRRSWICRPRARRRRPGIATIHQELNLVPLRSVTENIVLGYEPRRRWGAIDWRAAHARAREILARFGDRASTCARRSATIPPPSSSSSPSPARSRSTPGSSSWTSPPPRSTTARSEVLFGVIRGLRGARGLGALRQPLPRRAVRGLRPRHGHARRAHGGRVRADRGDEQARPDRRTCWAATPTRSRRPGMTELGGGQRPQGEVLLEAEAIASARDLRRGRPSLGVRAARSWASRGCSGSGRTETARAVFGLDPLTGRHDPRRRARRGPASPRDAIAAGIGFLTEDRKVEGIVPDLSVRENLTLALLPRLTRRGARPTRRASARWSSGFIKALGHQDRRHGPADPPALGRQPAEGAARPLAGDGARPPAPRRADARRRRRRQARDPGDHPRASSTQGCAVLLISSEFEELVEGADRIIVLQDGRSVAAARQPGRDRGRADPRHRRAARRRRRPRHERSDSLTGRPGRRGRGPAAAARARPARVTGGLIALLLLLLFNALRHAELPAAADAVREHQPGRDHRHRRRRHDAGHRHRRRRPVGGRGHGARRGAGAADLRLRPRAGLSRRSGSSRPSCCRSSSPRLCGLFNGGLRQLPRRAADHRHADPVHLGARHRAGADQRQPPDLLQPGLQLSRHRAASSGLPFQGWLALLIALVVVVDGRAGRSTAATCCGRRQRARRRAWPARRCGGSRSAPTSSARCSRGSPGSSSSRSTPPRTRRAIGNLMELDAIAAAVVGGALLQGGPRADPRRCCSAPSSSSSCGYTLLANGIAGRGRADRQGRRSSSSRSGSRTAGGAHERPRADAHLRPPPLHAAAGRRHAPAVWVALRAADPASARCATTTSCQRLQHRLLPELQLHVHPRSRSACASSS